MGNSAIKIAKRLGTLEAKLKMLSNELADKRSDISDILMDLANGVEDETWLNNIESRYIRANCGGTIVEYDTLTTLIQYRPETAEYGEWYDAEDICYE